MKVGDYIRINNGQIAKIVKIKEYKKWSNIIYTDIAIDLNEDRACNENEIGEEDIIISSPNIIDLIKVGDYINGYKITDFTEIDKYNDEKILYSDLGSEYVSIHENEIKSIVTKEQFESMEYKVVE